MCYAGCRYERTWGEGAGECSLPNGEKPPIDAMCEINDLHAENAKLLNENAKLRELVRHMRSCMVNKDCDTCVYRADACDFEYDMHELGIEVGDSGDGQSE